MATDTFKRLHTLVYTTITCGRCPLRFAFEEALYKELVATKRTWYCPAGHPRRFTGETREEQLQRELDGAYAATSRVRQ